MRRPPLGTPEDERQRARAARDAATATGFHARGVFDMLEAVSPYAARLLVAKLTGDDTTVDSAIAFLSDRYDAPATEAALVVGLAIGSRVQLTSADMRTARETLGIEAGGMIAAAANGSHARRRVPTPTDPGRMKGGA